MNEYFRAVIFIILGLVGGASHYFKKRYVDNTTTLSFYEYLRVDFTYTLRTFGAIVVAEVNLSVASTDIIHLSELIGAITAGYMANSALNKATE